MKRRKGWKHMKKNEFAMIKLALKNGVNIQKTSEIFNRSWSTTKIVQNSQDLNEYKKAVKERTTKAFKPKEKVVEYKKTFDVNEALVDSIQREERMIILLREIRDAIMILHI